ncbi:MAG TPA: hypothetical protein VNK95_06345, partial [Caldilineaceae bacterium]|nr:hypothetical protein [Caldilineaceae bacterium]
MKPSRKALSLLAGLVWLAAGCVGVDGAPLALPQTPPRAVIALAAMSDAAPLTAREIVDQVAPALAMIQTPYAAGSGVLVQPGYLVTSVDVVWPATTAQVRFQDGAAYDAVPVVAWDLLAGVAILGPLAGQAGALTLVDGSALAAGSD